MVHENLSPPNPTNWNDSGTYVVEPITTHCHTIILLHGLSSNGRKFGSELLQTGVDSSGRKLQQLLPNARFIFPTAKPRRSSAFKRIVLTQWFDLARISDPEYRKETQIQGLVESAVELEQLIRQEVSIVSPQNVIIGGLSQGCAMSLSVLLALDYPLGGFIGMSGYLPFRKDIEEAIRGDDADLDDDNPFATSEPVGEFEPQAQDPRRKAAVFERDLLCFPPLANATEADTAHPTPIFLGHGDADEKKPYEQGEAAARTMQAAGYEVVWKLYHELGHWYKIPDEIDDIIAFIKSKVGWDLSEG
ncbi:alpha/beta-hydrolase [Daldinia bambusicola]|nr:alpha/beta-hydrolase [Daldinia bambusicola]